MRLLRRVFLAAVSAAAAAATLPDVSNSLQWRSIGPAVMGGRITDLAAVPANPARVYAASASGGLFRTDNGGITWQAIFDRQSTLSIGAIAMDPAHPDTIWVGTGESNLRNSVSFGDGLYKSDDAGSTWTHLGLADTQTISRIVVNPKNPSNVFVAAVGHAFGPNADRGVFVTEDGGRSWKKTLFIDNEHGAVGLELDPAHPDVLYAGMWRFDRKPWTYTSGSEKGGVFRSADGGATWQKLGGGLPTLLGRVSIKVAPVDPRIVYVIAESKEGTLFRSHDGGATFETVSKDRELVGRAYYFTDLRVAPDSPDHIFVLADQLLESHDGGRHFSRASPSVHGDLHALWIDPTDGHRLWQGNDGGLAVSYDAGSHWEQVNNLPLSQLYHVSTDNRAPFYHVTVGMQDDGSWTGPSRTAEPAGIFNDDWRMVNGFTGFAALSDPDNPDLLITEQPGGSLLRTDMRTREQQMIGPQPRSFSGAPARSMPYRFNWDAPLVRSPFGKNTIYLAGNAIFQSSDGGHSWEAMSRDLTAHDETKLGNIGGPISVDNSASEVYATITALAESPVKRNLLWAGTDDGNLQRTANGGGTWENLIPKLTAVPAHSPVSHVEPDVRDEHTAYVSFDRHMFDDRKPYLFRTNDDGQTWSSIAQGLPSNAFIWTVRQDLREPNLLYVGTELGLYASFDAGGTWVALHGKNMPWSVAVREIAFQPQTNDLLVATHGRSLWVLDDLTAFQQLAAAERKPQLFPVRPAYRYALRATRFGFGDKTYLGTNPAYGALLRYLIPGQCQAAKLEILDPGGALVRVLATGKSPGLHEATWDLRYAGPERSGRGPVPLGPQAVPGDYRVRLTADSVVTEQPLTIKMLDPAAKDEDLVASFRLAQDLNEMLQTVDRLLASTATTAEPGGESDPLDLLRRPPGSSRSATAPRLRDELESLFNMIDSADAAPTSAQVSYYDSLKSRYRDALAQVEAWKKAHP